MKILLVYPTTPETFWSFKHVLLGFWHRGRLAYWQFCISTLLRRPRLFPVAIELAIIGHHFRRVARLL